MIRNPNTFFVYVPFKIDATRVSHKKASVILIEDFPQIKEIPDWFNVLVEFMAHHFKPRDLSDDENEPCTINAINVAKFYLKRYAKLVQ